MYHVDHIIIILWSASMREQCNDLFILIFVENMASAHKRLPGTAQVFLDQICGLLSFRHTRNLFLFQVMIQNFHSISKRPRSANLSKWILLLIP